MGACFPSVPAHMDTSATSAMSSSSSMMPLVRSTPQAHVDTVSSIVMHPSRPYAITASADASICAINLDSRTIAHKWTHHTRGVTHVDFGVHARAYLSSSRDTTVQMWQEDQVTTHKFMGHETAVTGCAFNEENTLILSGSRDSRVRFWDVVHLKELSTLYIARNVVTCIKRVPNSSTFLQSSEDKQLRVWDSRTFSVVQTFPIENYIHTSCSASLDGLTFATTSNGFGGNGCHATIWDSRMCKATHVLVGHSETVLCGDFIPNTTWFISSSADSKVKLWDVNSGKDLYTYTNAVSHITALGVDNERSIIAGLNNGAIDELKISSNPVVIAPVSLA